MSKIINIEEQIPHRVAETICVKCLKRNITVWPEGTLLKDLECEKCGTGFIILTGELIDD